MKINSISFDFLKGRKFTIGQISAPAFVSIYLLFVICFPLFASAAVNVIPCGKGVPGSNTPDSAPCTFNDLVTLGQRVTDFMLRDVALPFAVILFIWAGFLLMFKSASAGSLQEAKDIFWNAVFGFLVALAAVLIVKFILFALGTNRSLYENRLTYNVVELRK